MSLLIGNFILNKLICAHLISEIDFKSIVYELYLAEIMERQV